MVVGGVLATWRVGRADEGDALRCSFQFQQPRAPYLLGHELLLLVSVCMVGA